MKTLIINGSPRKNGDTVQLIRKLKEKIPGEVVEFVCYQSDIKGCVDCRYCWEHDGCCRKDGWQELEQVIQECDNLLIASPVYFFELPGKLLDIFSRVQSFWCARHYRKTELIPKEKKGGILLVGGGNGSMDRVIFGDGRQVGHGPRSVRLQSQEANLPTHCPALTAQAEPGCGDSRVRADGYQKM